MESNDPGAWRAWLRTEEVADGRADAGELFRRSFGHDIPTYPRHFVLLYVPPDEPPARRVVAYVHQMPYKEVYLGGGMCVDERVYRKFPRWLFQQVREQGGLACIVTRDSLSMLDEAPAAFGHVGEPRARQADLRTGYVDTGRPHLMVFWRKALTEAEKRRLIDVAESHGPF